MERLCFFLRSFLIDKLWRPDEQVDRAPIIGKLRRKSKKAAPLRPDRTAEPYLRSPSQEKHKKKLLSFCLNLKKLPQTHSHGRCCVILHDFRLFPPCAVQKSLSRKDTFPKRPPTTAFRHSAAWRSGAFGRSLSSRKPCPGKARGEKMNTENLFYCLFLPGGHSA